MRVRTVTQEPIDFIPQASNDWCQLFLVTVITPIYGGGVEAGCFDADMPIRAASIRGQLRFWWRLLQKHKSSEAPLSDKQLFQRERDLWGGMNEKDQDYSSKIKVRVANVKNKHEGSDINPSSYALFPLREPDTEKIDNRTGDKFPLIREGIQFDLTIQCPVEYKEAVWEALRWWASFGGIGARTRRGLGALEISVKQGEETDLMLPVTSEEASEYSCKLAMGKTGQKDAVAAWKSAIEKLQHFRSGEKIAPSSWSESHAIRGITKRDSKRHSPKPEMLHYFPRAALGLPIIFEFKDSQDPQKTELTPKDYDRLASPVIVKAMYIEKNSYRPIALRLPVAHLQSLDLVLTDISTDEKASLKTLARSGDNGWWPSPEQLQKIAKKYPDFPITANNGEDAISAFLNYFRKK